MPFEMDANLEVFQQIAVAAARKTEGQ